MAMNEPIDPDELKKKLEDTQRELKEVKDGKRFEMPEQIQDFGKQLRRMPGLRKLMNAVLYGLILPPTLIMKGQGKMLFDPSFRKLMFDRETKTGMLEDSIFAPALWCPNDEGTSLQYDDALAGRYAAFDFNRKSEFNNKTLCRGKGRLMAFPLEEIIDNSTDTYTPSALVEPLDLGQLMQMVISPKIDELVGWGLIKETNYRQAYENVGLYDQYRLPIELKNLGEQTVYQVTPKGNGLVFLAADGGEKTPEKKKVLVFEPGWYGKNI